MPPRKKNTPSFLSFNSIRILSTLWNVEELGEVEQIHTNSAGRCFQSAIDPKIQIAKHKEAGALLDTVIHEILHACWYQCNLPDKHEERIVSALGTALTCVLRDNPELRNFINQSCAENENRH